MPDRNNHRLQDKESQIIKPQLKSSKKSRGQRDQEVKEIKFKPGGQKDWEVYKI